MLEITYNTSYFGKAIWVTKLIHNNWMGVIIEDPNSCTPLKFIDRHQVNLKLSYTKKKHFMKISLLQQIKIGILSSYTFNLSLRIILNIFLWLSHASYWKIWKNININIINKKITYYHWFHSNCYSTMVWSLSIKSSEINWVAINNFNFLSLIM